MEVVFVLLPLALAVAGIMLALFIWAVRSGQFDDLETPPFRILFDDVHKTRGSNRSQNEASPLADAASNVKD
ncbi:MAG: cytochrome oxidase maturation protein, cbb3-type [Deltaproteobacteria bacterium RIFOXYA12_FULL_58_15]|nr:MAG: cytochrome oxidase maturation protein, cbb3-type [Deltaproteobacteria bacterium RIFOXYA12_FULL_58_15]OGR14815.1 MAG: cytochrome oxidase maturation protein, cbb3-type [Deltaproteobacteria bacterium RIFOXYB12_FULL_58_9]